MKQQIAMPKFKMPGQAGHWGLRALWIIGGLVVVQAVFLGVAFSRHQSAQAAALASTLELERVRVAAEAAARLAVPPAAPSTQGTTATLAKAGSPTEQTAAEVTPNDAGKTLATSVDGPSPKSGRRAHRASTSPHATKVAKAGGGHKTTAGGKASTAAASGGKSDLIDDLLKKFK